MGGNLSGGGGYRAKVGNAILAQGVSAISTTNSNWTSGGGGSIHPPGQYRISFIADTGGVANFQIYINGVPTGILRTVTNGQLTFTEDFNIPQSATVEIFMKSDGVNLAITQQRIVRGEKAYILWT
jgi:hypothetical protein